MCGFSTNCDEEKDRDVATSAHEQNPPPSPSPSPSLFSLSTERYTEGRKKACRISRKLSTLIFLPFVLASSLPPLAVLRSSSASFCLPFSICTVKACNVFALGNSFGGELCARGSRQRAKKRNCRPGLRPMFALPDLLKL